MLLPFHPIGTIVTQAEKNGGSSKMEPLSQSDLPRQIFLDHRAMSHVEGSLAMGPTLSQLLLARRQKWTCASTYRPSTDMEGGLYEFEAGRLNPSSLRNLVVAQLLREFMAQTSATTSLRRSRKAYLVFESTLWRRGDGWLKTSQEEVFFVDDEVYFPVAGDLPLDPERLDMHLNRRWDPGAVGVFARLPLDIPFPSSGSPATRSILQLLADNTVFFVVGAYDDEGLIRIDCRQ